MSEIDLAVNRFSIKRKMMAVLWPSFLMASAMCGVVFSFIDPEQFIPQAEHVAMGDLGIYTLGFFLFWLLGTLTSGLTVLLMAEVH